MITPYTINASRNAFDSILGCESDGELLHLYLSAQLSLYINQRKFRFLEIYISEEKSLFFLKNPHLISLHLFRPECGREGELLQARTIPLYTIYRHIYIVIKYKIYIFSYIHLVNMKIYFLCEYCKYKNIFLYSKTCVWNWNNKIINLSLSRNLYEK